MNVDEAIRETVRHLGGDTAARNRVAATATTSATTLTFEYDLGALSQGAVIELPQGEKVYVWDVDTVAKTAEVSRGEEGTTAEALAVGDVVRIQPRFFRQDVRDALLHELADLESEGLYAFKEAAVTFDWLDGSYDLSAITDLVLPYTVRVEYAGRIDFYGAFDYFDGLLRPHCAPPVAAGTLLYRGAFSEFTQDSDDLATVCGVPESAHDILPLGAAVRLLGGREAVRLDERVKQQARKDEAVPPGSLTSLARTLNSQRLMRLSREMDRQYRRWPARVR